ncbi:hypothetical protein ACNAN0_06700 [Agrilactobacillus fermenti]|uniref:hypothetical protein n=1 Tax=Agrilactobacillus fermenti TaxID=2586909 RepID=UPI001E4ACAD3|nr:hypothetical protein [Agrilactobacillus fermenti]MCD2255836.1 hypothetical protein [Agrilactobacillus fermenti]
MLRRKILIDMAVAIVVFLSLWFVSVHDRNTYQIQLDHGGLSQDALIFKAKSSKNMQQITAAVAKKKFDNFQIQFIDPQQKALSYIYAQHPNNNLSMVSGRNFNTSDFEAPLPFAIVGQDWTNRLYKPQSQAYLPSGHQYVAVIGTAGTAGTSPLNTHRFITVSPYQTTNTTPIRNLEVIADGSLVTKHKQAFSKIIKAKHSRTYVPKTNQEKEHRRWGSKYALIAIYGLSFISLLALTLAFYVAIRRFIQVSELDHMLTLKMKWGHLRRFALHYVISTLIGYLIGIWQTYLINYHTVNLFTLIVTVINLLVMTILIFKTPTKELNEVSDI